MTPAVRRADDRFSSSALMTQQRHTTHNVRQEFLMAFCSISWECIWSQPRTRDNGCGKPRLVELQQTVAAFEFGGTELPAGRQPGGINQRVGNASSAVSDLHSTRQFKPHDRSFGTRPSGDRARQKPWGRQGKQNRGSQSQSEDIPCNGVVGPVRRDGAPAFVNLIWPLLILSFGPTWPLWRLPVQTPLFDPLP